MKILIAEDDFVSRRVLEATLVKWGHETVIAENGEEALKVLREENAPPLAILDWMMPALTGVDVCRRIRELPNALPTYIILLTAKTEKEDIIAGLESGADDYLTKPFERTELRARIEIGMRIVDLQERLAQSCEKLNRVRADLKEAEQKIHNFATNNNLTSAR